MAAFPVLTSLDIRGYGLYPGATGDRELFVDFKPGLTLVLGANGLGKSTLVTILFRMLTGPFDLALPSGSIGTTELKAAAQNKEVRSEFGGRVNDGAKTAQATLKFLLGTKNVTIVRSLRDLTLVSCKIDEAEVLNEVSFQRAVIEESRLATFGEWILVLRTIIFFFEERRTLIWDPSAQRQLLRCLLLPPDQARRWSELEREILELDSRMRNLQSALRREQSEQARTDQRVQSQPEVKAALVAAEAAAAHAKQRQESLAERVEVADRSRHRHRLDAFRAQAGFDAAIQELERARLSSIESRFPNSDASMRYILARLMSDGECLVCKTSGQEKKRAALVAAIDDRHCVICDSKLPKESNAPVDISDERIDAMRARVSLTQTTVQSTESELEKASKEYERNSRELAEVAVEVANWQDKVNDLINQLPPSEQRARQQREDLRGLDNTVNSLKATIREKREIFSSEMGKHREAISRFAVGIKSAFEAAASGFLFEDSQLSWAPIREHLGQLGAEGAEPTEYPAFAVELAGSNFPGVMRRQGPNEVSESQREFIDLAFRMALIHVASPNQAGTIIIDAPESSLDVVFVDRAAEVLARFANANSLNRVVATSNLGAGELVPTLLRKAEKNPDSRAGRIIDLFVEGVPTRAIKELSADYEKYRTGLYEKIKAV